MTEEFAFIGHDFFGGDVAAKSNYRAVVKAAFDEVNRQYLPGQGRSFTPVYADTTQTECPGIFHALRHQNLFRPGQGYWSEIRGKITVAKFSIFDLTHHRLRSHLNENVILEYGVALGLKKQCHVLATQFHLVKRFLSNIDGTFIRAYHDDVMLNQAIIEICYLHAAAILQRKNS
jgi:hypothetical protein